MPLLGGTSPFSEMAPPVPIECEPLSDAAQASRVAAATMALRAGRISGRAIATLRWAATVRDLKKEIERFS